MAGSEPSAARERELKTILSRDMPEAMEFIHAGVVKIEHFIDRLPSFFQVGPRGPDHPAPGHERDAGQHRANR